MGLLMFKGVEIGQQDKVGLMHTFMNWIYAAFFS